MPLRLNTFTVAHLGIISDHVALLIAFVGKGYVQKVGVALGCLYTFLK